MKDALCKCWTQDHHLHHLHLTELPAESWVHINLLTAASWRVCSRGQPALWNVKQDQIYTLTMQMCDNKVPLWNHTACHISLRCIRQTKQLTQNQKSSSLHIFLQSWRGASQNHNLQLCLWQTLWFFFPFFSLNNIFMYNGIYKQNYKSAKKTPAEIRGQVRNQWHEKPTAVAYAAFLESHHLGDGTWSLLLLCFVDICGS